MTQTGRPEKGRTVDSAIARRPLAEQAETANYRLGRSERIEMRSSRKPVFWGGLILALALLSGCGLKEIVRVRNMPIQAVDLSRLADGIYRGEFAYASAWVGAEVTIADHTIEKIVIFQNRETKYSRLAEKTAQRVVECQRLDIDAVTGATTSAKAVLKAIENALTRPQQGFNGGPIKVVREFVR